MRNLNQTTVISIIIGLIVIVGGMFGYAYWSQMKNSEETPPPVVNTEGSEEPVMRIDAKHFLREDTHTVAGELAMPTPCDLLETKTHMSGDTQVIDFTVINNAETCAQVITPARFKISFAGEAGTKIEATWNGQPAILNLIEAGPNEDPEDFELFIKG